MPQLVGGEYKYAETEVKVNERYGDENLAEGRPGHKPITSYQLPKFASHPAIPVRRMYLDKNDYHGLASEGTRNWDNWNVAHVAAYHDDLKMLSLATPEECREPNKWGMTPTHMCGMGHHTYGPSLNVLYQLIQMGAADPDAMNWVEQTPWHVAQRMHREKDLKKFEKVLLKGGKPDNFDQFKEGQLRLRGKFAKKQGPPAAIVGTLPVALVFPGQGSQYVGMMKDLQHLDPVKEMLKKANTILGYDIMDIMLYGPETKLSATKYCQPAMYIAGLAAIEKLKMDDPTKVSNCEATAGLSLGEYTALTVAGVFDFETGLKLVKTRGEAMEHETTKPDAKAQSMMSVAGLDKGTVENLCAESCAPGEVCKIANFLFPKGFSCAGDTAAVEKLEKKVLDAGALQAKMLKTSGAFHTPIMSPAREKLMAALELAKPSMKPPKCKVYMNVTSKAIDSSTKPSEICSMLGDQLTNSVMWDSCMTNAINDGITEFFECGPSKQLKAMMKRIDAKMVNNMTNVLA
mmetsp:Transcript_86571/g.149822  ORF Transcript_86571/g.149822 Transcript_86571/m.149822 type:complete len:517 (-) Transcript_86571:72-1622(-)